MKRSWGRSALLIAGRSAGGGAGSREWRRPERCGRAQVQMLLEASTSRRNGLRFSECGNEDAATATGSEMQDRLPSEVT